MAFKVGDTVVYPHHGAALVEAVEIRVIKGDEKEYLVLRVAQGDLTVRVPAENVDGDDVRHVRLGRQAQVLVLEEPVAERPGNVEAVQPRRFLWVVSCELWVGKQSGASRKDQPVRPLESRRATADGTVRPGWSLGGPAWSE